MSRPVAAAGPLRRGAGRQWGLPAAFAAALAMIVAGAGLARSEMTVTLKDGTSITLPYEEDEVLAITYREGQPKPEGRGEPPPMRIVLKDDRFVYLPYDLSEVDSIRYKRPKGKRKKRGAKADDKPAAGKAGPVRDADGLRDAIERASAGTVITMAPGEYTLRNKIVLSAGGTADKPIVLRAERIGGVTVISNGDGRLEVAAPHWTIENLVFRGVCKSDDACEHALHLAGDADHTTIRNNRLYNFNAAIKANGKPGKDKRVFPDHVLIEGNVFTNDAPRKTKNPVTPIDVVGGRGWIVRGNFIADFAKSRGNKVSYGAFLKGNSRNGIFERNLVICEWKHKGGTRIGLSFGGGGVKKLIACEDGICSPMHTDGIMRDNIILNCPEDVGIYVNEGRGSRIHNNTLINTGGIDVRFKESDADIRNNVVDGKVRERNGGTIRAEHNFAGSTGRVVRAYSDIADGDLQIRDRRSLVDRGSPQTSSQQDFCGIRRGERPDIGAIEWSEGKSCAGNIFALWNIEP